MKNDRYKEYLNSGEWKHLKGLKLKQVNHTCQGCLESGRVLEVHHLTYERIGMELLTDLTVYCTECHKKAHTISDKTDWNKYLNNELDNKPKARLAKDIEFEKILNSI